MITDQELFNRVTQSLRTYGNPYGDLDSRGWGWVNPSNTNERCAIARLVDGSTYHEVLGNLVKLFNLNNYYKYQYSLNVLMQENPLVSSITNLFDFSSKTCNDSFHLEQELQYIATHFGLQYTAPILEQTPIINKETVEV